MNRTPSLCRELDQACFGLLFEIENFLRLTLRWELRGRYADDWVGAIPQELVSNAKQRAVQEREIAYLDPRKSSVLSYLNLSELKDILIETAIWDSAFKYYWPPQEVVRAEFRKLLAIRNKSAHFRPVTPRDVRVAHRFAEDLADWSRHYRRVRASARLACSAEECGELFEEEELAELVPVWESLVRKIDAGQPEITIGMVSHHLLVSFVIPGGSIGPGPFLKFMERFESTVTFCRMGDLADRFCCYLPKKVGVGKVVDCVGGCLELSRGVEAGMSSEDVQGRFELAEWEAIVPWRVEMPANFL